MSKLEWFAHDFKLAEDFTMAVVPLISSVEAQLEAIHKLNEKKLAYEKEIIKDEFMESQIRTLAHAIYTLEQDNKEKLMHLQGIKEAYIEEDLIGSLETLTSAEGGMEISEATCELMKQMNILSRRIMNGKG